MEFIFAKECSEVVDRFCGLSNFKIKVQFINKCGKPTDRNQNSQQIFTSCRSLPGTFSPWYDEFRITALRILYNERCSLVSLKIEGHYRIGARPYICVKNQARGISVEESFDRLGPVCELHRISIRKSLSLFINSNQPQNVSAPGGISVRRQPMRG